MIRALLRELRPNGRSVVVGMAAVVVVMIGLVVGVVMGFDRGFKGSLASGISSGVALLGLAPAALLFVVAGLLDPRPLPRGLWVGAAGLSATGVGLVLALGLGVDRHALGSVVLGAVCCGGLPGGAIGLLSALSLLRGFGQVRAGTAPGQVALVRGRLEREGAAPFAALAGEAGLREDQLLATLAEIQAGGLPVVVDRGGGLALRKDFDQEGIRRLPGVVGTAGRISLEALGRELGAPVPAVRRWVQENVGHGRFHGAIDWREGVLFARDSATLKEGSACPSCGGRFVWVGKGLLRCPHCDAQIVT
jgi:hypothetical protein